MEYVKIPIDFKKIKTIIALKLSKRQLIGLSIALGITFPIFFVIKSFLGVNVSLYIFSFLLLPMIIFVFRKKNDLDLEKYLYYKYLQMYYHREKRKRKELGIRYEKRNILLKFIDLFLTKIKKREYVEDLIPLEKVYDNGIFEVEKDFYTKVIEFEDINYQLALKEDKDNIFVDFVNFLNSFDSNTRVQLLYQNSTERNFKVKEMIEIENDKYRELTKEYKEMLKMQLEKGNNGVRKSKYIIFGVESEMFDLAKSRLDSLELDINNYLKNMGVRAKTLSTLERLEMVHDVLNPRETMDLQGGLKKVITPKELDFSNKSYIKSDKYYYKVNYLNITANELNDRVLSEILAVDEDLAVSFNIKPVLQSRAIKLVKSKASDIDKMKVDENKKAIRQGYDMDLMPNDLKIYSKDLLELIKDLQKRDEKLFEVTITIMNIAKNLNDLNNSTSKIKSIVNKYNLSLLSLDYLQEKGVRTTLGFGVNELPYERSLTSTALGIFIPFTTQELLVFSKDSLYYGINPLSNNLIMADRKKLKNPNGLILGVTGSGKSFSAKREITNVILTTDDDVIVCDPEREYSDLVSNFGGEIITISSKTENHLNPLDLNMNYGDGDAPLKDKANFIISLIELVVGGSGLTAEEKSVIDRCLPKIYNRYFETLDKKDLPILEDLYEMLIIQDEKVGRKLATEMEIYVKGSLNVFNHETTVDINKQLICFDIKELGTQLKKIGMLIIQDQVWNKVSSNRDNKKATRYYIDELHLLLREELTAQYTVEMWKRFRKWGGIPTGITQNTKDLLASREIQNIFDNSDFLILLDQAKADSHILAKEKDISNYQLKYITNAKIGEGLIIYGNTIVPFIDNFPQDTKLYEIMSTKLNT